MLPPSHSLADNVPKPGYMALTGWVNVAGTWMFPNSSFPLSVSTYVSHAAETILDQYEQLGRQI